MADETQSEIICEERELYGRRGSGEVTLAAGADAEAADQRAAAGRAWLAIAQSFIDSGDREAAYRAADMGVDELGNTYLDDLVEDDTTVKLLAAADAHGSGAEYAATAMARVLETRLAMYIDAQQGRVLDS
jgi:hypothetical protein